MRALFVLLLISTSLALPEFLRQQLHNEDEGLEAVRRIHSVVKNDDEVKHHAYEELAYLTDVYGPRLWGSVSLDRATAYIHDYLVSEGIVTTLEPARNTPMWKRGAESLTLHEPRNRPQKLNLIGLGKGVGGNAKAEAVVFESLDLLKAASPEEIKGKIVVVAQPWENYLVNGPARTAGPAIASDKGAVGYLTRSVASGSINSPHTGTTVFGNSKPIPAAAISVEDAEMLVRMKNRKDKIVLELHIEATLETYTKTTYNIIGEIKGSEKPEEVVIMGGHIDSWDTGSQTGANDDGGGFMVCIQALRAIQKAGLKPKRTIRFVGWVGEEFGDDKYSGFAAYRDAHLDELDKHVAAFESDLGTKKFLGIGFNGGKGTNREESYSKFQSIVEPLTKNEFEYKIINTDFSMIDVEPLHDEGVTVLYNIVDDKGEPFEYDSYFKYHHTAGDTMTIMDREDMDSNVSGIASFMYLLAESGK